MDIPKKIHFTCKDKNNLNNATWEKCLLKYRIMYPEYEIILHDNQDIYKIIQLHYPEYLDKIKQIKIGAVLADIFRYIILYLEGGIYSDLDCEPLKKIDELLVNEKHQYNNLIPKNSIVSYNKDNLIENNHDSDNIDNCATILCYEFHPDFVKNIKKNKKLHLHHSAPKIYGCQICQWFMISKPKQEIFLKMFISIMKKIDILINILNEKNYCKKIISICGPSGFTEVIMNNFSDKLKILPSDFFCTGSWHDSVPLTENSYVKHHYTSSWHKKNL